MEQFDGSAVVGLEKPFALNTTIQTKGELEGETIEVKARLLGSLQDVQTEILLDGDDCICRRNLRCIRLQLRWTR